MLADCTAMRAALPR